MRVHVKICGIREAGTALAAVAAGADALGFVMTESVRRVTPAEASAIVARIPGGVERVAVMRHPSREELEAMLRGFEPDLVQAEHDALLDGAGVRHLPVFREAPGIEASIDAHLAGRSEARFVYEGVRSGMGEAVDWRRARGVGERGRMMLAGGLTPENVGEAIRTARPFGVDVSSGVESRPGVKDPGLIRAFVAAVREAERGMPT
jgi:phosphoribosylanthranilate isomerase